MATLSESALQTAEKQVIDMRAIDALTSYLRIPWIGTQNTAAVKDPLVWIHPFFSHHHDKLVTGTVLDDKSLDFSEYLFDRVYWSAKAGYVQTLYDLYQQTVETKLFAKTAQSSRHVLIGVGLDDAVMTDLTAGKTPINFLFRNYHVSQLQKALRTFVKQDASIGTTYSFFITTDETGSFSDDTGHMKNKPAANSALADQQYDALKSFFTQNLAVSLTGTYADACMNEFCKELRYLVDDITILGRESVFSGLPLLKADVHSAVHTKLPGNAELAWAMMKKTVGPALALENIAGSNWTYYSNPDPKHKKSYGRARITVSPQPVLSLE